MQKKLTDYNIHGAIVKQFLHFGSIPAFEVIDLFDNHIRTNAEHTFV